MSELILENSDESCFDLQDAATGLDCTTLQRKLTLSRLHRLADDDRAALLHEMIDDILFASLRCRQDTKAIECLKVLIAKGISLSRDYHMRNINNDGYPQIFRWDYESGDLSPEQSPEEKSTRSSYADINVDHLTTIPSGYNPKSIINTVKFVLTHGGRNVWLSRGDQVILDKLGIMDPVDFDMFTCVGEDYIEEERRGKKPNEIWLENRIRMTEREWAFENQRSIKEAAEEEMKTIYKKLSQGTPERDSKAAELKRIRRERDASGGKKTVHAFLKEKSARDF